jgi:hypothetical protein
VSANGSTMGLTENCLGLKKDWFAKSSKTSQILSSVQLAEFETKSASRKIEEETR